MGNSSWTPLRIDTKERLTAVITGASSGIGEGYARHVAGLGMNLVVVARRQARLEQLAADLRSLHGIVVETRAVDLTSPSELDALAHDLSGRSDIDLLVNNAGLAVVGRFWKTDSRRQLDLLQVHVLAPTRLTHAVLPQMIGRNHGAIVQVSSLAGLFPALSSPTYGPSKAYLNTFTWALRRELAETNVCLQALCPGFVVTEFHSTSEFDGIDMHERIPSWLWLSVDEVVEASVAGLRRGENLVIPGRRYQWIYAVASSSLAQRLGGWAVRRWRSR
jgi:short-subunit dehydrogenase